MHMSCHLRDCLLDFGPFSTFWCFPYECYNGVLEGVSKSWILPEKQMFLKFLGMQRIKQLTTMRSHGDDFLSSLYEQIQLKAKNDSGSLGQSQSQDLLTIQQIESFHVKCQNLMLKKKEYQHLVLPFREKCLTDTE